MIRFQDVKLAGAPPLLSLAFGGKGGWMAIKDLITVIPPPKKPRDAEGDWEKVESKLGITYPTDFRRLIKRYGTGEFLNGLLIYNPFNSWCFREIPKELETFRIMRDKMEIPLVIHPDEPGLFPWGHDVNGNNYCWMTEGKPNRWPVILLGHGYEDKPLRADENITAFLANFALNKHREMSGGIRFTKSQLRFVPGLTWEQ
jgi:cell wall assembly regulator SMI1